MISDYLPVLEVVSEPGFYDLERKPDRYQRYPSFRRFLDVQCLEKLQDLVDNCYYIANKDVEYKNICRRSSRWAVRREEEQRGNREVYNTSNLVPSIWSMLAISVLIRLEERQLQEGMVQVGSFDTVAKLLTNFRNIV